MSELADRLRRIRAAVAHGKPRAAKDLAERALSEAEEVPELQVLAGLAARDLGRPGATEALAEALARPLGDPQDRLAGWVAVAEEADRRRRWDEADQAWVQACHEGDQGAELLLGRAGALLRAGRSAPALPLLQQATESDDSALALSAWLVLSGLFLADWKLGPALQAAEQASALARSRHNWLAFSAAEIDRSEVRVRRQDRPGALEGLVAALQVVRERGDPGALLVARVHEVRSAD